MSTSTVTDSSFEADVLQADEPVVVDFWAEWCGPCKAMGPDLEDLATKYDGKVKIAKLNVDENPNMTTQYNIRGLPTLLVFKNGEVVSQQNGALPRGRLESWIDENT
ncbi:MAG: thioredoxin [Pseudomonadota bacterium]